MVIWRRFFYEYLSLIEAAILHIRKATTLLLIGMGVLWGGGVDGINLSLGSLWGRAEWFDGGLLEIILAKNMKCYFDNPCV